jgi:aspartate ammonia-lyase
VSKINWKKVNGDMVRTELQIALESAQGQGAMVAKVKRYAGKKKAAEVAKAGLKSLLADEEVAKAALQGMGLSEELIKTILKQASPRD